MRSDNLPCVPPTMKLSDVIIEISNARLGIAIVLDGDNIEGIVTDGDVRRAMLKYQNNFFDISVNDVMTKSPKTVSENSRITEAEEMMIKNKIHSVIVVSENNYLSGIIEFYDTMP